MAGRAAPETPVTGTATRTRPMPAAGSRVDTWMNADFKFAGSVIRRRTIAVLLLGTPALVPLVLISRPVIETDSAVMTSVEADVLGTGSMALLLATLSVTALVTLTGQRWFVPLRRWYGIVFGLTAVTDAILAGTTGDFTGGVPGRLAGHTFLLAGLIMTMLLVPLTLTACNAAMRWLGKNWKRLQRLTYVIWALLGVHLALLEGLGIQHGINGPSSVPDGVPVLHQRLYQLVAASLILLVLRVPAVRRWCARQRAAGQWWLPYLAFTPLIALFLLAYGYIVNEEFFKGIASFRMQLPGGDG